MSYQTILVEKKEGIATITLNRPEKLNVYTDQVGEELLEALEDIDGDKEVRVVVITGAGRAFCAGADVRVFHEAAEARRRGEKKLSVESRILERAPMLLKSMGKPVIASINGPAMGIGCTIALACDIRIASETASIGAQFVRVGLIPEFGSTYFLPRVVGIAKACELVFTGRIIDAKEAKEIGLVNQVVAPEELSSATLEMARSIAKGPPIAIKIAKRGLYQGLHTDLATQLQFELFGLELCFQTEDHLEGVKAFLEKRQPNFQGR